MQFTYTVVFVALHLGSESLFQQQPRTAVGYEACEILRFKMSAVPVVEMILNVTKGHRK